MEQAAAAAICGKGGDAARRRETAAGCGELYKEGRDGVEEGQEEAEGGTTAMAARRRARAGLPLGRERGGAAGLGLGLAGAGAAQSGKELKKNISNFISESAFVVLILFATVNPKYPDSFCPNIIYHFYRV